jgi:hypothetical protein
MPTRDVEVLVVRRTPTACPRPAPPPLEPLDERLRPTHPVNLARLTLNVDLMAGHIADQGAALDCYERRTTDGER